MRLILITFLSLFVAGCSSLPRTPFTEAEQSAAQVPGIANARFYSDSPAEAVNVILNRPQMYDFARRQGAFNYLALSGGAWDGAYGAGVMNGWTMRGDRPEFALVSGVSAGALIAPFAFLGPEYDGAIREAFTGGLATSFDGGFFSLLGGQDMQRETLFNLVAKYVDEKFLRRVAEEHARGRRLIIMTVNLDAQRAVIWNMGAIASSRSPRALQLFRDVLTASSSIPGVFAPTRIEVTANGRTFSELHVDGGVISPVFTIPESFIVSPNPADVSKGVKGNIYVVINSRLGPEFEVVEAGILPLASRSLSTLIKAQARSTLIATLEFARARGSRFALTYIDNGFPRDLKPGFSDVYMNAVYKYGEEKGASARLWADPLISPDRSASPRRLEAIGR